jgi:hypothetical protein
MQAKRRFTRPARETEAVRLYGDVASFKNLLIWYTKSPSSAREDDYLLERAGLLADVRHGLVALPDFVSRCPTLDHFETLMADQVGPHPPARVRYLTAQFKPLLASLEAERRQLTADRKAAARDLRRTEPLMPSGQRAQGDR